MILTHLVIFGFLGGAGGDVETQTPAASVPMYVAGGTGWSHGGGSGSMQRTPYLAPQSLHSDEEENEMATIAAFVIGNIDA